MLSIFARGFLKFRDFVSNDIQNHFYHYSFKRIMKLRVKNHDYSIDKNFQKKSKDYWKKYTSISTMWHDFYSYSNGIKDVRYIPENLYYSKIEPYYNKKSFADAIDDKNFYGVIFKGYNHSTTLIRNISGLLFDEKYKLISLSQAIETCLEEDKFVIKPSINSMAGSKVKLVTPPHKISNDDLKQLFQSYDKDYVVEKVIKQHEELSKFNKSSANTIRLISFLDKSGVHILSSVFRMGNTGSFTDNFSSGGIACGIDEKTGKTKEIGYNQIYQKFKLHPNGYDFRNKDIIGYFEAENVIKDIHQKFGHFRVISWDIVINENGDPVILEFNITPQSVDFHQICNGPLFGDLTERVLEEVFNQN